MLTFGVVRTAVGIALTVLLCSSAGATDITNDQADAITQAKVLISNEKPVEALNLLRSLTESDPDHTDAYFFLGIAALNVARLPDGHPGAPEDAEARKTLRDEAVESYRHILQQKPGLLGVRLELAKALFERGHCLASVENILEHLFGDDCDAAAHQFRRALAGDLPEAVVATVSRYLAVIQERKRVSGQFRMAVAPDSNVNAGTDAETFRIRSLPVEFEINEEAQATSGIGVVVAVAGDYRHPLALQFFDDTKTRLRIGGSVYRREYSGRRFDDMTLSLHTGPEVLFQRGRVGLLARADHRSYAGDPVSYGLGLRLDGGIRLGNRLWLSGAIQQMERRYQDNPGHDGARFDVDLNLALVLTPAITLGVRGGWQRAHSDRSTLRSGTLKMGAFTSAELPPIIGITGFGLEFSIDTFSTTYDEPGYEIITPDARRDQLSISRLTLYNNTLDLFGFTPGLSLIHERRESNIDDLFDYRRNLAELSFRRLF